MDKRINTCSDNGNIEAERRDFERTVLYLSIIDDEGMERNEAGDYIDEPAQAAWLAWQAARATPPATGETEDLPPVYAYKADDGTFIKNGTQFDFAKSGEYVRLDDVAHYLRKQAGQVGVKTWQERMPEPRWEKFCDMNCSPRPRSLDDCPDCVSIKCYGDPVAARDAEIAELRAALAPWSCAEGGHGEPEATNFRQEGEQPTNNKGERNG